MMSADDTPAARVAAFFDATAADYDRIYAEDSPAGRLLRTRAAAVVELLGDVPGTVLDAGMGGGWLCAELDRRGWTVSGVDVAPSMVEVARARLPHLGDGLLCASITELPFAGSSFDAVVATGVLEYVASDLASALGELVRVLRPGGVAVVSFPNYGAPMIAFRARVLYPLVRAAKRLISTSRPPPPRVPRVPFDRFVAHLRAQELRIEDVRPVGPQPLPARVAARLERRRSPLAYALGTQRVVRVRKAA